MDFEEGDEDKSNDETVDENEAKENEERILSPGNSKRLRKGETSRRRKFRLNSGKNCRKKSRPKPRSQIRKKPISLSKKSWKSANAWLNFMQDFRQNFRDMRGMKNASIFRLASERWSEMSAEQKKPYIDVANRVKRMKQQENKNKDQRESPSKKSQKLSKSGPAVKAKVLEKKDEKYDYSETECDSEEEESVNEDSNDEFVDNSGSIKSSYT